MNDAANFTLVDEHGRKYLTATTTAIGAEARELVSRVWA